jgi:hypothetical protein
VVRPKVLASGFGVMFSLHHAANSFKCLAPSWVLWLPFDRFSGVLGYRYHLRLPRTNDLMDTPSLPPSSKFLVLKIPCLEDTSLI